MNKICIVTSSFPRYKGDSSGIFIYNIVNELIDKYEIHIIYPTNIKNPLFDSERFYRHMIHYPFKSYPMSQVRGADNLNSIRLFFTMAHKLTKVIKDYDIDLIHSYWAIPAGFVTASCNRNIPQILTLPGSDIKIFSKKALLRLPVKHALKKASSIIACSHDLKQEVLNIGVSDDKIEVIPAGVNTKQFKPQDKQSLRTTLCLPDCFIIVYLGSLLRIKRVDRIIKACADIACNKKFYLIIIGDGPEKRNLIEIAKANGVNNIMFTGCVPHELVQNYLAASNVIVIASESEGLPGCVQEGMACGLPVIATDVGGLPEIVMNGKTGFLISNDLELKEKLKVLINAPEVASTLGNNSRVYAQNNLSIESIVNKIDRLYTASIKANQ